MTRKQPNSPPPISGRPPPPAPPPPVRVRTVRSDALLAALKSYRCQYTVDHDGDALLLVDVLSSGETIAEGEREIRLLAEHLSFALTEEETGVIGRWEYIPRDFDQWRSEDK